MFLIARAVNLQLTQWFFLPARLVDEWYLGKSEDTVGLIWQTTASNVLENLAGVQRIPCLLHIC